MGARTETVKVGGTAYRVRELTVGEIRGWFAELEGDDAAQVFDWVDDGLFPAVPLSALRRMVEPADQLDELTPAEVRELQGAAERLNADFFALLARLHGAVERTAQRTAAP